MYKYNKYKNQYLISIKKNKKRVILIRSTIIFLILFFWEFFSRIGIINTFIFSSPLNIIKTIFNLLKSENLLIHIKVTTIEIFLSFLITSLLSLLISIIFWWNKTLFKIFEPILLIMNAIPKIALGPLIIIWIGAGFKSIIFMALLITIFTSILNMYNLFNSTNTNYIILFKSFGSNKLNILFKLILPCNYIGIIEILKINISMTFIGVIMGELLVSKKGLGYLIMYGTQVFNINLVLSIIIVLGIITYFIYLLVCFIEKLLINKNYSN